MNRITGLFVEWKAGQDKVSTNRCLTSSKLSAKNSYPTPGITGDIVIVLRRLTRLEFRVMGTSVQFPAQPSRRAIVSLWVAALLLQAYPSAYSQYQGLPPATANEEQPSIPSYQLDSLVAPIALYPDPLLAQTLAASTYPLEVIQLEQWYANNKYLKDQALADAVARQPWDTSIQALVAFPNVFQRMADNIQWTTDLGNAFLAQQSDVMDAVQRMRAKAQGTGNLTTNAQQKVETQTGEGGQQAIVIEQVNPDVLYVPSYDPQIVYGAPPPAYPYYPYTYRRVCDTYVGVPHFPWL